MRRTSKLITSACIAALVLAACGSSYKGLSKAEFVKQADAICVANQAETEKLAKAVGDNPTVAEVKDVYADQLMPAFEDQVDELRALKPPEADRETISKMLDDLSAGIDQAGASIATMKSLEDLAGVRRARGLQGRQRGGEGLWTAEVLRGVGPVPTGATKNRTRYTSAS